MEKRLIICDTNVWYNLAESPQLFNLVIDRDLHLVPTALALKELITNDRTVDGKNGQVFTFLRRFMSNARVYLPFVYLYREQKGLSPEQDYIQFNKSVVENFHKRVPVHSGNALKDRFDRDFQSFKNLRAQINEIVQEKRNEYKPEEDDFERFYERSLPSIVDLLSSLVAKVDEAKEVQLDISKIEVFLRTILYFDWTKLTQSSKTVGNYKDNDFNDLFNLLYLREGELFWTFESRSKQNFKKAMIDSGNEAYLFDPDEEWNQYLRV